MANINEYLWVIANKIYGRDIRMAIHDALDKINIDINEKTSVLNSHTSNIDIHATLADKIEWNNKQDSLTAGDNITIINSEISSKITAPTNCVIAPSNAIEKERADIILPDTSDPAETLGLIRWTIDILHNMRESTDVAIRIDLLGGSINLSTAYSAVNLLIIPVGYDNIHIFGNGVDIYGRTDTGRYLVEQNGVGNTINGVHFRGTGYGKGVRNTGSDVVIKNSYFRGVASAFENVGDNCKVINSIISANNTASTNAGKECSFIGNTFTVLGTRTSLDNSHRAKDTTVIGNTFEGNGLRYYAGTVKPATLAEIQSLNIGSITER